MGPKRQKTFRSHIQEKMVHAKDSNLRFLPAGELNRLVDSTTVVKVLQKYEFHDTQDLASFVCNEASKVFAILVWADAPRLIQEFFQHNFVDKNLPVHLSINDEDMVEVCTLQPGNASIDSHPFNNDLHWTERTIDDFCNTYQWPFLSPVFIEDQFRYKFHENTHMPFIDEQHRSQKETFFSVVEEWRLHRDHILAPSLIVSLFHRSFWDPFKV